MSVAEEKTGNRQEALDRLMGLLEAPDFPGKLMPEHISQYRSKLGFFTAGDLEHVAAKIQEEIDKKRDANKTLLISKIEDITALTKMELMLSARGVPPNVVNLLLSLLVNKSSNFAVPIFEGKVTELFEESLENSVFNIVLEKAAAASQQEQGSKGLKELFDRKIRDTETLLHLIEVIDGVKLNAHAQMKAIFTLNLLAEAMKRDETMRKSESITMKDMINIYLLSKIQLKLSAFDYPNETLEGILINRLGQSNNIRRQFRILDRIIDDTISGALNIERGSKTEKLEWLQLINELEVDIALAQYEEKLQKDKYPKLDSEEKNAIRRTLMADNIADQTIAAISFARRLDNPDESLHEPGKLSEIASETQYLTSMIFKVKGLQIKEVYEFVELIGELDVKNENDQLVVEFFRHELPYIDKAVLKEDDPDIKKAALACRYLSARLMARFDIHPNYLRMATDHIRLDAEKLPAELRDHEDAMAAKVALYNEIRKRVGFFNKAERAFLTMNDVEATIDAEKIELTRDGVFRILEKINDVELKLAVAEYVRVGTITRGQDDGTFDAATVEAKVKALFKTTSIEAIEKEAVEKNLIPESILEKAKEEREFDDTVVDIRNYATYLVTRRLDKPEYPRHLQRALNLIVALIQDAIGWRHFENSQLRAKQEVVPLIEEYHNFLSRLLDALADDHDPEHEEIISKLRDDDFFAVTDNKDSLEAGKKSAPQVKAEFVSLMNDNRFQQYVAKAMVFANQSKSEEWRTYRAGLDTTQALLNTNLNKTLTVLEKIINTMRSDPQNAESYRPYIQTLEGRYYESFKRMQNDLNGFLKPASVVKIEYNRVANSEKFKVFLKHSYELIKEI